MRFFSLAASSPAASHPAAAAPTQSARRRSRRPQRTATATATAAVAALAFASVLLLAALPAVANAHEDAPAAAAAAAAAAAPHGHHHHHHHHHAADGIGSNNGHNQVHAAHVKHLSSRSSAAAASATSSKLPSPSSKNKSNSKSSSNAGASVHDAEASSNRLGASMREGADGLSQVYSVKGGRATELVGSGVDTYYTSNSTACSRHYTVTATDTCDIIGHKTHTSTYQIMALNLEQTGPNCFGLEAGMRLCLGRFGSDCQLVHRVRNAESCTDLLRRYDISREVLIENNPNLDCGNIYDGLNLCVAPGRIAPPEPRGMYVARRSLAGETEEL
ncbi:hypothetical protein OC835_004064 [Tilletia horrida]|nr:hypothetical protein OC835_004064 [Tilletia horrida]